MPFSITRTQVGSERHRRTGKIPSIGQRRISRSCRIRNRLLEAGGNGGWRECPLCSVRRACAPGRPAEEEAHDYVRPEALFPFELDRFQKDSADALERGESILVAAPTGSGKTAVAECAIHSALHCGRHVVYTSPLKALSNQKYHELASTFGESKVGLVTGDFKVNAKAQVLVMTTEILRNILYAELGRESAGSEGNGSGLDFSLLKFVILDEIHYLGDKDRGTVWEECLIYMPRHVQLVCLSATMGNARELSGWARQVHGKMTLVTCDKRPVPLTLHWTMQDSNSRKVNLSPFYRVDEKGGSNVMSPYTQNLADLRERAPDFRGMLRLLHNQKKLPCIWFIFRRRACDESAIQACKMLKNTRLVDAQERQALFQIMQQFRIDSPECVNTALVKPFLCGVASHHAGLLPAWKSLVEEGFQAGLIKLVFATHTLAAGVNMPAKTTVISELERRDKGSRKVLTYNELMQMAGRAGRRGFDEAGHCILMNSPFTSLSKVAKVVAGGPQAITSSFKTDFGMVLNLVDSKGIDNAKALINCSFLNYQGRVDGMAKALGEGGLVKAGEEREARNPKLRKVKNRLAVEVDFLQTLLSQILEIRGQCVDTMLGAGGGDETMNPCLVALDHEGESIGSGDGSNMVLALLVGRCTGDTNGETYYYCVSEGGCSYKVSGQHIASVGVPLEDEEALAFAPLSNEALEVNYSDLSWEDRGRSFFFAERPNANKAFGLLHPGLIHQLAPVGVDSEMEEAVMLQRSMVHGLQEKLDAIRNQMQEEKAKPSLALVHDLLSRRKQKVKDYFSVEEHFRQDTGLWHIEAQENMTGYSVESSLPDRLQAQEQVFSQVLKLLQNSGSYEKVLQDFDKRVEVLAACSALDPGPMTLRPLGRVASQLHADNQLWLALVATSEHLFMLNAPQLAAVTCAAISSEAIKLRPGLDCLVEPSEEALQAIERMEGVLLDLVDLQLKHDVTPIPRLDAKLSGIAELWALGAPWAEIVESVDLDEGDLVRVLHRTQDILRQFAALDLLPSPLRMTCREALISFERSPLAGA